MRRHIYQVSDVKSRKALSYQSHISNRQMSHFPYSSTLQLQSELILSPNILHGSENNTLINKANVILGAVSKPFAEHLLMSSDRETVYDVKLMDRMSLSN